MRLLFGEVYRGAGGIRLDDHHSDAIDFAHDHDFYEVFVVTGGRVLHELNGRADILVPGASRLIRPFDLHRFDFAPGAGYDFVNLPFTPEVFRAAMAYLDAGDQADALNESPEPPEATLSPSALDSLEVEIRAYLDAPAKGRMLNVLLLKLLSLFLSDDADAPDALPDWMRRISAEMKHPANLRGGIESLYRLSGFSPAHISRSFQKHLGVTPTEYVNALRLSYAQYLLKYTGRSVVDISMECGFETLSHFYHLFSASVGQSPAAFRREFRGT